MCYNMFGDYMVQIKEHPDYYYEDGEVYRKLKMTNQGYHIQCNGKLKWVTPSDIEKFLKLNDTNKEEQRMISSERQLEDYICDNQKDFIKTLRGLYGEDKDIQFVGRQVRIGSKNIADLVYAFEDKEKKIITFVIVELKFRLIEPNDLAQLARYMGTLKDKVDRDAKYYDYTTYVLGLFVSFGENELLREMMASYRFSSINVSVFNI